MLLLALTLSFTLGIGAFASETEGAETNGEESSTEIASRPDQTEAEAIGKNPFEAIFDVALNYSSEIFSLLAFAGTLIVAYFYKKLHSNLQLIYIIQKADYCYPNKLPPLNILQMQSKE